MTLLTDSSASLYYRESGGFAAGRFVLGLIGATVAATVLAAIYAYCDLYNPCISVVTFVLTIGFGWVTGAVTGRLLQWAHVRNRGLRVIGALVISLAALYASWIFWLYALVMRYAPPGGGSFFPITLVRRPTAFWHLILFVNEHGAWTIGSEHGSSSNTPVTGLMLWLCWVIEAALIVGSCLLAANQVGSAFPYCEACGQWARKKKQLFTAQLLNIPELQSQLEDRNFAPLVANSPAKAADASWLEVWTHSCEQCQAFNTMTIKQTTQTVNKKGQLQKSSKVKIAHLLLSTVDLRALEALRKAQKNPPPAPPPIAEAEEGYEEEGEDEAEPPQPAR